VFEETVADIFSNHQPGAALGHVPWVPVNPWISRTWAKETLKFKIKCEPWELVNPWIEIPNVVPARSF